MSKALEPPRVITLVADPFAKTDAATLSARFPDMCLPFKDHYFVDLSGGTSPVGTLTHRFMAGSESAP